MRAAMDKQRAAAALQQSAVRIQAEVAGATMMPWAPDFVPSAGSADCDPLEAAVVTPLIENAAKTNELDVRLLSAVIERESGFRPCAMSAKGAQGLMQLMPDTAGTFGVSDPFDPKQNIAAGSKYLKQLLDYYKGNTKLALAAYNAGSKAVDASNGVPDIDETKEYVAAILKKIQ